MQQAVHEFLDMGTAVVKMVRVGEICTIKGCFVGLTGAWFCPYIFSWLFHSVGKKNNESTQMPNLKMENIEI